MPRLMDLPSRCAETCGGPGRNYSPRKPEMASGCSVLFHAKPRIAGLALLILCHRARALPGNDCALLGPIRTVDHSRRHRAADPFGRQRAGGEPAPLDAA